MAGFKLGEAFVEFTAKSGEYLAELNKMSGQTDSTVEHIGGQMSGMGMLVGAAVAAAAAYAGKQLYEMGKEAIDAAEHLHDLSMMTGISTENLSRLDYLGQTAGLTLDDISRAAGLLAKQMNKGTDESGMYSGALLKIGVASKDSKGNMREMFDVLKDVADVFQKMPDGPQKTALAMEILGRGGKAMIPLLNEGADGIQKMADASDKFGYTIGQRFANEADEFNDHITMMENNVKGFTRGIMADLMPSLNVLTHYLVGDYRTAAKTSKDELSSFSEIMLHLSWRLKDNKSDFADWVAACEKAGVKADYTGFAFARMTQFLVGMGTVIKYGTHTVGAAGVALFDMAGAKQGEDQMDILRNWYKIWWADMGKITTEGAKALEDEQRRVFGDLANADKNLADQLRKNLDDAAQASKENATLQKEIIQKHMEIAKANKNVPQERQYADGLAIMARDTAVAAGADKNLADTLYTLTMRLFDATVAAEKKKEALRKAAEQARKDAEETKKVIELETKATEALHKSTMTGIAAELQAIDDRMESERKKADLEIKNAVKHQAAVVAIEAAGASEKIVIRKKYADDVETIVYDSEREISRLHEWGKVAELAAVDDEYRAKRKMIDRELTDAAMFAEALAAIDAERAAKQLEIENKYSADWRLILENIILENQKAAKKVSDYWHDAMNYAHSNLANFLDASSQDFLKFTSLWKGMLGDMEKAIANFLADQIVKSFAKFLLNWITQRYGLGATTFSGGTGPQVGLAANGGIFQGGLSFGAFANGGVVDHPMLGLVGEGKYNEAVVPLPDGKTIQAVVKDRAPRVTSMDIRVVLMPDLIGAMQTPPGAASVYLNRELLLNGEIRRNIMQRINE